MVPLLNNGGVLYKFEYNLADHLGNVRAVFAGHANGRPELMQTTDYYPFGMVMAQQNFYADTITPNRYLYNGKEVQNDVLAGTSLDWFDYGARLYDAALGRWHQQDPVLEEYHSWSPYNYAMNNPILMNDPTGMWGENIQKTVVDPGRKIIYHDESADKNIYRSKSYSYKPGDEKGMDVIGEEQPGVDYSKGSYLNFDHTGKQSTSMLDPKFENEGIDRDYTIESLVIPVFGFLKCFQVGKYLYKLVPTKTGKLILKFVGLADDAGKGVSVIGPRATYREYAKKIGANFLDVTDEAWSMRKNVRFLQGVVKRGDDVIFAGKYNPDLLNPKSVLAQEIRYLKRHGYSWTDDFTRMIKK